MSAASTGSSKRLFKNKAKFCGLEISRASKLHALKDEYAKLKKLLAEAMLENAILKDVASKRMVSPHSGANKP